jgi:hypothetical protein
LVICRVPHHQDTRWSDAVSFFVSGETFLRRGDVIQEAGFIIEISESRVKKAIHLYDGWIAGVR